jgi:FlaA1/EpsC-like NDP-sugar epimerase
MTGFAKWLVRIRRPIVVLLHLAVAMGSNYAAFWLRYDGDIPLESQLLFRTVLPWLIVIRGLTFIPFRLYEGLWRYTSVSDLLSIVGAVVVSSSAFYGLTHWVWGMVPYPRSVFLIDSVLLVCALGGLRLTRRIHRWLGHLERGATVLIYGAGDTGEMIARDLRYNAHYDYLPIGFVDDDRSKVGRRIHGVRVLGTGLDLPQIIAAKQPHEILMAIPSADPSTLRRLLKALEPYRLPIRTLPSVRDLRDGVAAPGQIRPLEAQDLLERVPVGLDAAPVRHLVAGKRVLVTGAGGSIGSELSRQIAALGPGALIVLDRYENGLHALSTELRVARPTAPLEAVVADVTDASRIQSVLSLYRPQIVFHAAAHKHVPLMELNPCEAVKNNARGTRVMAELARDVGIERFILISSDKAVNPSSVMGATKRVAEMVVQAMNGHGAGVFTTVRFGNVLASNGSVVPHFLEQIRAGGPVTVTHPEMRRYFMLISEAVHLLIHAAAMAEGDGIFVLDMGEQVKVLDLARNLIRLAGFVPDEEIKIVFTGVRPGEKLREELVAWDETAEPSAVERILRVRGTTLGVDGFDEQVADLERAAAEGDSGAVRKKLAEIVPTYHPNGGGGAL